MIRMVTPNTNVTAGSIDTTFLGDKSVTGAKINTTGALDKQVLSYDLATDTVVWQDVSYLDNTFENGIVVSGAQSVFNADVQINADLDLNGDIAISGTITDLTGITADSSFTLQTVGAGYNITLDATGYVFADTDDFYVGSLTQAAHITGTSIGAVGTALQISGDFTGDLTGDVTGNLDGNVDAESVEINNATKVVPSNWTEFGFDAFAASKLKIAGTSITDMQVREYSGNNAGFFDIKSVKRTGDISTNSEDLMIHNTTFVDTNGGGNRRTASQWTRLRNLSVTGTGVSDYQYDQYLPHFEIVTYPKASGSTELAWTTIDSNKNRTQITNELQVVARQQNSGNVDLSALRLRYVGTELTNPEGLISLYNQTTNTNIDMIRFKDDAGSYETSFLTDVNLDKGTQSQRTISCNGDIEITNTNAGNWTWFNTDDFYFGATASGGIQLDETIVKTWGGKAEIEFDTNVKFTQNRTVEFNGSVLLPGETADPTPVTAGQIYFNTTTGKFRGYNGTSWVDLG